MTDIYRFIYTRYSRLLGRWPATSTYLSEGRLLQTTT